MIVAIIGSFLAISIPLVIHPAIKNDLINIKIVRDANFPEAGLRYYDIYINDNLVGDIGNNSSKQFDVKAKISGKNEIYFKLPSGALTGPEHVSEVATFIAEPGDIVMARFTVKNVLLRLSFPVEITCTFCKYEYKQDEATFYQYITSNNSLVPIWFKTKVRPSLDGMSNEWRYIFFAQTLQCPSLLRLLAVSLVLCPVFSYSIYLHYKSRGLDPESKHYWLYPVLIMSTYLLSWVVKFVIDMIAYAMTGVDYYVANQVVFFYTLGVGIMCGIAGSFHPLSRIMFSGTWIRRALGFFGIILEVLGALYTIRDTASIVLQ